MTTPSLGLPLPTDGQDPWGADVRLALTTIDHAAGFGVLPVRSVADLTSPLATELGVTIVGNDIEVPAGVGIMPVGLVDIGNRRVVLDGGWTSGLSAQRDGWASTATTGVVVSAGQTLVLRDLLVVAPAGPGIVASGGAADFMKATMVGVYGSPVGFHLTGFAVPVLQDCFVGTLPDLPDPAVGVRFDGTVEKVLVSSTAFYDVSDAAIVLADTLDVGVVDIAQAFYLFDSPGAAVRVEVGATVGEGLVRGSLISGSAVPIEGATPASLNWTMSDNSGIRNSRIAGALYLTAPATTDIVTQDTYTVLEGAFALGALSERFELVDSTLVYRGQRPALVDISGVLTVDPSNNVQVGIRIAKNGSALVESTTVVEQGAGPGSSPRPGAVNALLIMEDGDAASIEVANLDNTSDVDVLSCSLTARG